MLQTHASQMGWDKTSEGIMQKQEREDIIHQSETHEVRARWQCLLSLHIHKHYMVWLRSGLLKFFDMLQFTPKNNLDFF